MYDMCDVLDVRCSMLPESCQLLCYVRRLAFAMNICVLLGRGSFELSIRVYRRPCVQYAGRARKRRATWTIRTCVGRTLPLIVVRFLGGFVRLDGLPANCMRCLPLTSFHFAVAPFGYALHALCVRHPHPLVISNLLLMRG